MESPCQRPIDSILTPEPNKIDCAYCVQGRYPFFMNSYVIKSISATSPIPFAWDAQPWRDAAFLEIASFCKESSDHRPVTRVKLLHGNARCHVLFQVQDRYVRSLRTKFQSDVWNDSCVEWFVQPKPDKGYFNFEINAGGVLHVSYITDPKRDSSGLRRSSPLPPDAGELICIYHSLPCVIDPEIRDSVEWSIGLSVPVTLFERYVGSLNGLSSQKWRANFNKCADETSHPHWATWNPVAEKNFHRPQDFGEIVFE
jgi:hypothetical protein